MEVYITSKREGNELEVTGVSRSGRVCKKSSKLMDFESSSNIIETKVKRPRSQTDQNRKKKIDLQTKVRPDTPEVTQTIHVAEIHQPPSYKLSIASPNGSPQISLSAQKKKKIESSSDYETQSQSTLSGSEDENDKSIQSKKSVSSNIKIDSLDLDINAIVSVPKKTQPPKKLVKTSAPIKTITKIKSKPVSPPKQKTRYTAYMLWSKETRQKLLQEYPSMDFTAISKRLGELWATVPNSEKYNWSNRAKRLSEKNQILPTKKFISKTTPVKSPLSNSSKRKSEHTQISPLKQIPIDDIIKSRDVIKDPMRDVKIFRAIELEPIDVAAYLKLLGESLTMIGERLKEHNGQITVSGSLSVLLDSLLCALGSLVCLTQQVPATRHENSLSFTKTLENIAYIMPGL
ncbi:hypothetical protein TKK_0012402 [Trichogramma kaykai]|uniref:HMG box domain-containing protein n=1 Tax=Trichogramma kaykai TaxID=54128 RepID=A0ABD2WNN7_9HYME